MKNKFVLSAFLGVLFAISVYIICFFIVPEEAFILALFSGLGFYLLLFIFLLMHERFLSKKYTEFEKNIFLPIFYKTNGNFNLGNGKIRNGNIYFCEAGIICVSVDERPYTLDEIAIQNIEQYQFDNIHLNIYTKDNRLFVITTPDADKIIKILKKKLDINIRHILTPPYMPFNIRKIITDTGNGSRSFPLFIIHQRSVFIIHYENPI